MAPEKICAAVYGAVLFKPLLLHNNCHFEARTLKGGPSNITNVIGYDMAAHKFRNAQSLGSLTMVAIAGRL